MDAIQHYVKFSVNFTQDKPGDTPEGILLHQRDGALLKYIYKVARS